MKNSSLRSGQQKNRPHLKNHIKQTFHEHKQSFSRAQVTSLTATAVDFTSLYVLVEFIHIHYVAATACGAFLGAITNFLLNRHWTFDSRKQSFPTQGFRYFLVSAGSLMLNTLFVFLLTDFGHLRYLMSKGIAALVVGWAWNYPLQRYFVFLKGLT